MGVLEQAHDERLTVDDLKAMASGRRPETLDDMDFLETLAGSNCLVMPPYVYHLEADGHLEQVTALRYDDHYNLNKPVILLAVMDRLRRGRD